MAYSSPPAVAAPKPRCYRITRWRHWLTGLVGTAVAAAALFADTVPPTVGNRKAQAAAAAGRIPSQRYPADELFTRISPQLSDRPHNQPTVINGYLLLAGNAVHEFWDISDPYSPVLLSEMFSPYRFGEAESHQVSYAKFPSGGLYLVTVSGRGIDLWGIENVNQPSLLSALELPNINYGDLSNAVWGLAWQGDYIYVGATTSGLYIVDASDPTQPQLVTTLPTVELGGVAAGPLFALGNLLVITTPKRSAGVVTMDISDPANPILLDFVKPGGRSYIGSFYGSNAHLISPFRTFDVTSDPRKIEQIGSAPTPSSEYLSFGDGHLYLGGLRGGTEGIWKYDIGDPNHPTLIGRIPGRDSRWDDQFSVPIGNLIAISDDENVNGYVGSFIAVHDTEPDTQPPVVDYVNPPDGAVDQPPSSRIALSFSDQIEFASVDSSTLIVRPIGGQALTGKWGYSQTVVSFWPDQPLQPDTDYEVVARAGGITDLVGNAIANEFRSVFRTGTASPLGIGGIGELTAVETAQNADFVADLASAAREYHWDFGDGHQATGPSVSHSFDAPGRYTVTLSVLGEGRPDEHQAETASLSGGVVVANNHPGYSGSGFVDFPAVTGSNVKVQWQIDRDSAGNADIDVRYANGGDGNRSLELVVNGNTVRTVEFKPTGSWWNWQTVTIANVALDADNNTLGLIARGSVGPNIDRLVLPSETLAMLGSITSTQVVHRPIAASEPARSSTVIITADRAKAWAVNPDADTVTAVDTNALSKAFETSVGLTPRTLAQAPDGTIWVVNEGSYDISVLDSSTGAVIDTIDLPYGSMPYGIAFAPDGSAAYVTLQALGRLVRIDAATRTIVHRLELGPDASGIVPKVRGIAIDSDSRRVLVARFVSPERGGEIYDVSVLGQSMNLDRTIALAIDPGPDSPDGGRGIPNYISSLAISPDGVHARVPSKKDNIERGSFRDGQALTHDNAVRTVISQIDLSSGREDLAARIDLNDHDMAFALTFSPLGDLVFAAIQGSNVVNVIDAYSGIEIAGIPTGLAPQGLTLDDQGRLYVQNFMSRSLSVFAVAGLLAGTESSAQMLAEIGLVANETLSDKVLMGKQIFYDASSSKMSFEGYISCASCHLDGGQDGRTWDFTDRGEGLRNTIALQGRGGTLLQGPVHWSGNFDEIQDFENDIRSHFGGSGFMSDDVFNGGTRRDPLGDPKAGLSAELDALAAYVSSLTSVPLSPYRNPDGSLTPEGVRGKQVFANEGCVKCHGGAEFTDSALGVLHDIGTISPASGGRLGQSLEGLDTPTLKGAWATAPYLHDGSAPTLAQAIDSHSDVSLSDGELRALVSYVRQIDELELPKSSDATLAMLSLSGIDIGELSATVTSYQASIAHSVATTTVTVIATHPSATVLIAPGPEVSLAEGANEITVTVTAEDGTTTQAYTVTVTRAGMPEVSIAAVSSPVTEGTVALFEVGLAEAASEALTVAVSVTESGSMLSGVPPVAVAFSRGDTSATLSVPTAADSVVEADSAVTAVVEPRASYRLGTAASATVTVEDDDAATFAVTAAPAAIDEGESATLTVAISNGVTFGEDQTILLAASGTASPSDYTGMPAALTLVAEAPSVTATLVATMDQVEEAAETVTATASHGGSTIGTATVTINSISHDATLASLSLSGVDIGTFSGAVTSYQASVAHSVAATAVTATATHAEASVSIAPGAEVALLEGANEITVTVTAEDGTTTKTYTVTVTRVALPVATVSASASPVAEGTAATFTVTLDETAREALTVTVSVTESGSALSGTPPASVAFNKGETSVTLSVPTAGDSVVEADSTVTASVTAGTGYAVGTPSAAVVTVEDDDAATFTVSADPAAIEEGESATLTVAISNGVTFAEDQAVSLATSGTASASDYTGVPPTLTLAAGAASGTATLAAAADQQEEADETVTVTATHAGTSIGTATVTIHSISHDATLGSLSLSGIEIGTFSGAVTSYQASVANSVTATTVTATATHPAATVSIKPGSAVTLAEGENAIAVTVTAEDGTTTKTYTVTVTRVALPVATVSASASPVAEGTAATFLVTLDKAAQEALNVAVSVTESGSALSGAPPASVAFNKGETSATLSVPTAGDSVVEADSTVTVSVTAGTGYAVGTPSAAVVTVEDDDAATFTVSADPAAIEEGESATLTVAISNGVTFAEDQAISLATSGTASASDYTGVPPTLTLAAGAASGTATLAAAADQQEEADETVTVTATHAGTSIGSATVTIHSISHDATLGSLSLSGIEIGTFSAAVTSYRASVANSVTATTVAATATHPAASVSIRPGSAVTLAEGENAIAVTVTAEDGTTRKTYTVTVTRAVLPVVSIAAVKERVTGPIGAFTVTRAGPTAEPLEVQAQMRDSRTSRTRILTFRFPRGQSSLTRRVQAGNNKLVEDDITMTWTLQEGEGYTVSAEQASASLVLEESDTAELAVSAEPAEIAEGESATVTVATTNGVRFGEDQTITLSVSGTASGSDYTGVPATLTLPAYRTSATATLTAVADDGEEDAETVTVTASHGGSAIGSATVTINSVSHDATLAALSLSGVEIGTFSGAVTSYQASVANSVTATTVTATASHSEATVSIDPGSEVSLAEGANRIAVTVTAESGRRKTYTVTVTRVVLPVVSIAAVKERVRGPIGAVRATRTGPTAEPLEVQVHMTNSRASRVQTLTFRFPRGQSSLTRRVQAGDNKLVEDDITVTWTLQEGEGYTVSAEQASASVVLEESDIPAFAVSAEPAEIAEGESATVTVATTNGVRFGEAQTIALSVSGTASGSDYTGVPATLTLPAYRTSTRTTLTAVADQAEEADETVTITASHGGAEIGSATVTVTASGAAPAGGGFPLALENSRPSGIWSDGETAWVADLADARLYAYRRQDGERQPAKDIATEPAPMGLWSDGETLWVAGQDGGLRAHRLADGARLAARDLALDANAVPAGVWSDTETVWVSEWLGGTVHAYGLASGRREAARDIQLAAGNLMPVGLWGDGETLWVADWRERVYAYRLSDGGRDRNRDLIAGTGDEDPTGLWSDGGTLLATSWEGGEVRAFRLPTLPRGPAKVRTGFASAPAAGPTTVADPALKAAIREALGKAPGEPVSAGDLAGLEFLSARNGGVQDLAGLEAATGLKGLDLGFNPLEDLRLLASLPALESLNVDGSALDLGALASLQGLRLLSVRHNLLDDVQALAALTGLMELDIGDNRITSLAPLAGLTRLRVLRADHNHIKDLWPLATLTGLKALDLAANRVRDLKPLAGLERLRVVQLAENGLEDLHSLSGLKGLVDLGIGRNTVMNLSAIAGLDGLRRLDLRGNAVGNLWPLRGLPALVWVHVGGSRIKDLASLEGLGGLTVAGQDDLEPPAAGDGRLERSGSQARNSAGR